MRGLLFAGAFLSAGAVITGCPIYASQDCFDTSDCPHRYVCDSQRQQCRLLSPTPTTAGSQPRACTAPAQCRTDETCGTRAVCEPGDCTQWGCVSGFRCETTEPTPTCVARTLAVGGASGAGGQAASAGGSGNVGQPGGAAGAAGAGGMTTPPSRYENNGLPLASGFLAVNNNQWQLPLGGMASRPAATPATLSLAGGDSTQGELWTFTVSGQPDVSSKTIACNATSDPHALCRFFLRRTEGGAPATYIDNGTPFLLIWSSWGEGNFRAVAANVGAIRTANGTQTTYSFDSLTFDFVAQTTPLPRVGEGNSPYGHKTSFDKAVARKQVIPDALLAYVTQRATRRLQAERVWLFGSRARGDERARSDIDLGFEFPPSYANSWPAFVDDIQEHAPTLLRFDLIDMNRCSMQMRNQIKKEGRLVYGIQS